MDNFLGNESKEFLLFDLIETTIAMNPKDDDPGKCHGTIARLASGDAGSYDGFGWAIDNGELRENSGVLNDGNRWIATGHDRGLGDKVRDVDTIADKIGIGDVIGEEAAHSIGERIIKRVKLKIQKLCLFKILILEHIHHI